MRYLAVFLALFAQVLFSTHALAQTDAPTPRQGGAQDEPAGVEARSPYDTPGMTLEEQEAVSRNSAASQEVNRNLNSEFARYVSPTSGGSFVIFVIAIVVISIIALVIVRKYRRRLPPSQ